MIEDFFTEERRIQKIVNEAVYDAVNEAVLEERQKNMESQIINLSKLDLTKDKIQEITGYPIELVNEVLNKSNN